MIIPVVVRSFPPFCCGFPKNKKLVANNVAPKPVRVDATTTKRFVVINFANGSQSYNQLPKGMYISSKHSLRAPAIDKRRNLLPSLLVMLV